MKHCINMEEEECVSIVSSGLFCYLPTPIMDKLRNGMMLIDVYVVYMILYNVRSKAKFCYLLPLTKLLF